VGAADDARRSVDIERRSMQNGFTELARRWKAIGLWLLALAVACWVWVVARALFGDTKAIVYGYGKSVEWAMWLELMLVLAVSVPLGVAGAVMYARGATSVQLSYHAVSMAQYLDRAQAAAYKARDDE